MKFYLGCYLGGILGVILGASWVLSWGMIGLLSGNEMEENLIEYFALKSQYLTINIYLSIFSCYNSY